MCCRAFESNYDGRNHPLSPPALARFHVNGSAHSEALISKRGFFVLFFETSYAFVHFYPFSPSSPSVASLHIACRLRGVG